MQLYSLFVEILTMVLFFLEYAMGMGCPFHCSGDRATSTLATDRRMAEREVTPTQSKLTNKSEPHHTLSEDNELEEQLNLKALGTAVNVLTTPPVSKSQYSTNVTTTCGQSRICKDISHLLSRHLLR